MSNIDIGHCITRAKEWATRPQLPEYITLGLYAGFELKASRLDVDVPISESSAFARDLGHMSRTNQNFRTDKCNM